MSTGTNRSSFPASRIASSRTRLFVAAPEPSSISVRGFAAAMDVPVAPSQTSGGGLTMTLRLPLAPAGSDIGDASVAAEERAP